MGVSKNNGTPKWMVYNGKPYWSGWFGGTTIFDNIHILSTVNVGHSIEFLPQLSAQPEASLAFQVALTALAPLPPPKPRLIRSWAKVNQWWASFEFGKTFLGGFQNYDQAG